MPVANNLSERLTELCKEFTVPGASIALLAGESLTTATSGTINSSTGAPVRPDTLFAAGSITKVLTASLAMALVDEGLLDLDAHVVNYLPDIAFADPERAAVMTIRMLLNHSSGLPHNYMPDLTPGSDVLERLMPSLAALPIIGNPGERWCYSNMGMSTLGRIVEVVTAQNYDTALNSRITEPLSLNATTDAEELLLRSVAVGHSIDPETGEASSVSRLRAWPENAPAGSRLWIDAKSLVRFGQMHFEGQSREGRQILSSTALEQMRTPQFDEFWGCFPMYENYGLGWAIAQNRDELVLVHGGGNIGMHSNLFVLPDSKVALAVLTNSTAGHLLYSTLCSELLKEYIDFPAPASPSHPQTSVDVESSRYSGTFEAPHGRIVVETINDQLHVRFEPELTLAEADWIMSGVRIDRRARPLVCIDDVQHRFVIDDGAGTWAPVQFYDPNSEGQLTLVRLTTLFERSAQQ